jgi:hypothetical protein
MQNPQGQPARRENPKGVHIMGATRIMPGDTVTVVPSVRCTSTKRICDGGDCDSFIPAPWHTGHIYQGVAVDVDRFWTVTVEHAGGTDFVPYDNCTGWQK